MTGYPENNIPAFRAAAEDLRTMGHDVVSPVELDEADGFDALDGTSIEAGDKQWAEFLLRDLAVIADPTVEAVVVLPGWEKSGGANHEVRWARSLGKHIIAYPKLTPVSEGEVRVVNPKTGGAKGRKPQRLDLVPWEPINRISEVYAFGASKYDDHNWRKGYEWSLSFAALMRHMGAFWEGEDVDPESGLPHVAHAGFHVLTLLAFMEEHGNLDDRPNVDAPAN